MIAELLAALKRDRRELAEVQQRLDALLRRGRPEEPIDPNQPLLFPELAQPEPAAPASPAVETEASQPRKGKPHGRRRPARQLRREQRRYELPTLERLCPECGTMRGEIGVQTTEQYDYKPAEVFVVEHQRVKYACKCCEGHVAIAPKPPQPLDKGLPGPGLLAQIIVDKYPSRPVKYIPPTGGGLPEKAAQRRWISRGERDARALRSCDGRGQGAGTVNGASKSSHFGAFARASAERA